MDASLVLAVDGLRAVAHTASEVIVANAAEDGDRAAVAVAADVEIGCLTVLGQNKQPPSAKECIASPSKKASSLLGALNIPFLLGGGGSESATSGAGAKPAADPSPEERAAQAAWRDAVKHAQLAPVTDIIAVFGSEALPQGFSKVTHSVTGAYPADLNASSGAKQMWLATARFPNAPAITGLTVVILELGEFIPPNFQPVRHLASGKPANLRFGSAASEAYLCFTRAPGAPIVDVGICFPYGASTKPDLRRLLPGSADDAPGALPVA